VETHLSQVGGAALIRSCGRVNGTQNPVGCYLWRENEEGVKIIPAQNYAGVDTVEVSDHVFMIHPAFRSALRSTSSIDIPPYRPEFGWRQLYQYSEVVRKRSPVRGTLEISTDFSEKELKYIISRIQRLQEELVTERGVPAEVNSEVNRSLSAIISELQETSLTAPSPVELRLPMARATRYLRDLKANLEGNGYLTSKSSLSSHIVGIIDALDRMSDRLY